MMKKTTSEKETGNGRKDKGRKPGGKKINDHRRPSGGPSHDEVMRLVQQILRTNPDLMDLKTPWDNPEDFHNKDQRIEEATLACQEEEPLSLGSIRMNPNEAIEMKRMKLQEKIRPLRAHLEYRRANPTEIEICVSAISRGDLHAVKSLVKEGFKLYRRDACGVNGLMIASAAGHFEIAKFLLESRVYVNARDEMGYTALWRAVMNEHPEMVKLLLEWGADPDMRDMFGWTALDYLCRMSAPFGLTDVEFQTAEILVEFGATINE